MMPAAPTTDGLVIMTAAMTTDVFQDLAPCTPLANAKPAGDRPKPPKQPQPKGPPAPAKPKRIASHPGKRR